MLSLARICPTEDILLAVKVANRRQLFDLVAQHLQSRYGLNAEQVARRLHERENMGSTGLGQCVATPHARLPGLNMPLALYVRPIYPIPFDAPDGKPVADFIVLLVPEHANQSHLQLLAEAARLFCLRPFRQALRAIDTPANIRRLLLDYCPGGLLTPPAIPA